MSQKKTHNKLSINKSQVRTQTTQHIYKTTTPSSQTNKPKQISKTQRSQQTTINVIKQQHKPNTYLKNKNNDVLNNKNNNNKQTYQERQ